jgi:hypothetical protein
LSIRSVLILAAKYFPAEGSGSRMLNTAFRITIRTMGVVKTEVPRLASL